MKVKNIIISFLIIMTSCAKSQNQKNPDHICKNCGNYDLEQITFDENVESLVSKTEVSKTVFVNADCQEKTIDELLKSDKICAFKYYVYNQPGDILGKGLFTFSNQFKFDNLNMLLDSDKKLVSYNATVNFEGDEKAFDKFVSFLTDKLKVQPKSNRMVTDNSFVYQWDTSSISYQLTRSDKKKQRQTIVNGKSRSEEFFHITFTVSNKVKLNDKTKYVTSRSENFVIFGDKYFKK